MSSNVQINIMVVVDTEGVKSAYHSPSQNPDSPTGIDHKYAWMICADPRGVISGQGSAELKFSAYVGDDVSFYGTSIDGNSDDAIILYDMKYWQKDHVFDQFRPDLERRNGAVMPDDTTPNGLPAIHEQRNFSSFDTRIGKSGTEDYYVMFALYQMDDTGENQVLFGYFYWDPTCVVP